MSPALSYVVVIAVAGLLAALYWTGARAAIATLDVATKPPTPTVVTAQLTDQQLCRRVDAVAARLRAIEERYRALDTEARNKEQTEIRRAKTEAARNRIWSEARAEDDKRRNAETSEARRELGEVLFLRDELYARVPGEKQRIEKEHQPWIVFFDGSLAGPSPLSDAAAYLESIARKICP